MINELYTAYKNLKKQNIAIGNRHPDVKSPGKKAGFVVGIGDDGLPKSVEYKSRDQMHGFWTHRKGKHNSFPFVSIKEPLRKINGDSPDSETRKELEKYKNKKEVNERIAILKKTIEQPQKTTTLSLAPVEWTKLHFSKLPPEKRYEALFVLMKRLEMVHDDKNAISQALCIALDREVSSYDKERLDVYEDLIIGHWEKNKKKQDVLVANVPIFLDVDDYIKYECRLASVEMGDFVGNNLPHNADEQSTATGMCSLTGLAAKLEDDKFPDPDLPAGLGETFIFSKNRNTPCETRYGKTSVAAFPVDFKIPTILFNTIRFLTKEERKGKTWRKIPNHKEENDLLIVYLEDKPNSEAELGSLLSDSIEIEDFVASEASYEETTAKVLKAIDAEEGINDNSKIQVLIISKFDFGRKPISLTTSFTVKNIKQGVEEWRKAFENTPDIQVPFFNENGKPPDFKKPPYLSPAKAIKCMNTKWIREGKNKVNVPIERISELYTLYLGPLNQAGIVAERMLSHIIVNSSPLLLGIGGALKRKDFHDYKDENEVKEKTLLICSFLSILLYKLCHKKEVFMKDVPFNIGRLFALADSLHNEYCVHVRKGKVPPQLIGNALVRTAMENPVQGLARLQERLFIYQAWANTVQGDGIGLAKWLLGQMGTVTNILAENNQGIPERTDDKQKAQMLLGYLARSDS